MATPWRFESSPGHQQLFRRKPKKSEKPRKINVLRGFLLSTVPLCSTDIDYFCVYTESRGQAMPKQAEPKSEVVFRVAKPRERPYLLTDGNGLALRVWPDGSKNLTSGQNRHFAQMPSSTCRGPQQATADARCQTRIQAGLHHPAMEDE